MPPVREVRGRAASDGIYAGPIVYFDEQFTPRQHSGSVDGERKALGTAISAALADIAVLMAKAPQDGVDILALQLAILEDPALSDPAFAAISRLRSAHEAWTTACDTEIAGYEDSDEDYFRARAADLKDIRDRVLRHLSGPHKSTAMAGAVLAGKDMGASLFLETDWTKGGAIALSAGSPLSHVAMLARARGVPMVVGLGSNSFAAHSEIIVDGSGGVVIFDPTPEIKRIYDARRGVEIGHRDKDNEFLFNDARRRDGSRVELLINVASVEELDHIDPRCCDGIGLMRSEFLFRDDGPLPDEEQQFQAYMRFLEWAGGRPVTIRTLDIGGDKPIRGLTPDGERNPFLGLRGVRLTLARLDVFRTQIRALCRAAAHGLLKVMIPMVTAPRELADSAALFDAAIVELRREGHSCTRPPLGIMVEVPAAALAPELFADASFFSIGSNDLTQYVMAAARDDFAVAGLNDPSHPAITRLIASVAAFGQARGIPVSLCGDMASDPVHLPSLMEAGLTSLSVSPASVARVKAALAEL